MKRIFGGTKPQDVVERYRVRVVEAGSGSRVTLQNAQGVEQQGAAASRILTQLAAELR